MIVFLTDDQIIDAAERGARRFMAKCHFTTWFDSPQDVFQEAYLIALGFLRKYSNPKYLDPVLITCRVYYSLIDTLRARSKYRTHSPTPQYYLSDCSYVGDAKPNYLLPDFNDLFKQLHYKLTFKEAVTFDLLKEGFTQAQIARELCVSRPVISRRVHNIRRKMASIM